MCIPVFFYPFFCPLKIHFITLILLPPVLLKGRRRDGKYDLHRRIGVIVPYVL